jgi:hypothetical protein
LIVLQIKDFHEEYDAMQHALENQEKEYERDPNRPLDDDFEDEYWSGVNSINIAAPPLSSVLNNKRAAPEAPVPQRKYTSHAETRTTGTMDN